MKIKIRIPIFLLQQKSIKMKKKQLTVGVFLLKKKCQQQKEAAKFPA